MRRFKCLFCNEYSNIREEYVLKNKLEFRDTSEYDDYYYSVITEILTCQNTDCKKQTVLTSYCSVEPVFYTDEDGDHHEEIEDVVIRKHYFKPEVTGVTLPEYIPENLKNDYREAYLIKDLSPKASATLSRRCLQGMIRDFWKISKGTLNQEINALNDKLDSSTLGAIHALREIGNIGAHMSEEKGTKEILDVTPGEAEALLGLIEILFKDWYIAKYEKEESFKKLMEIAESKKQGNTD